MPRAICIETLSDDELAIVTAIRAPGPRTLTTAELRAVAKVAKGMVQRFSACQVRPEHCRVSANVDMMGADAAVRLSVDLPPEPITL